MDDPAAEVFEFPGTTIVRYQFPLRSDMWAVLSVPKDLSAREVERLTKFLESLPLPEGDNG